MNKFSYSCFILILTAFHIISCDSGGSSTDAGNQLRLEIVFPSLIFDRPIGIENAGDGTNRLFVAEHRGVVKVVNNTLEGAPGTLQKDIRAAQSEVFLDIQDQVLFDENELGLLGLTFHPNYENNGFFYLNYIASNPLRNVISRFTVSEGNPNIADADSEVILLNCTASSLS